MPPTRAGLDSLGLLIETESIQRLCVNVKYYVRE